MYAAFSQEKAVDFAISFKQIRRVAQQSSWTRSVPTSRWGFLPAVLTTLNIVKIQPVQ